MGCWNSLGRDRLLPVDGQGRLSKAPVPKGRKEMLPFRDHVETQNGRLSP
jgi:hypothetical protein